jgi:YD repeat-containing protein
VIRRLLRAALAVAVIAGCTVAAMAGVTLRNGNFYMSYTDVAVPGGFEMKIERVYNSKTDFTGIFGSGWGFEYEAYLRVQDDGSVVVHEYGGGAENHFMPITTKPRSLDAIYDELTAAAEKLGQFSSVAEKDAYRAWVVDHHEAEFERFRDLGLVKTEHLGIGQTFRSGRFGNQILSRVPEGYQRAFDTGRFEEYDLSGHLVRVWDANHNFVALHYDAKGHLTTMEDSGANRFVFAFNNQGYVKSIAWGSRVARYEYKGTELVKSTDVDGRAYRYTYDLQNRHNMTGIHYSDGTDVKVTYYPLDEYENVKELKDRDGTLYVYQYDRSIKDHYGATVTETDTDRKVVVNKYDYFVGHAPSGDTYTARMVQSLDGDVSDTTYNADAQPLSITRNGVTTKFEYDSFGHVTLKQTATQTIRLTYDPVVRKVASVTTIAGGKTTVVSFKYDAKGNLIEGTDPAGHDVAATYDENGRVSTLAEKSGGTMHIVYNRESKMVQVAADGLGTISVTYKENGDVAKITSDAGDTVAQKVTAMLQQMMAVIKPPAVSLTF